MKQCDTFPLNEQKRRLTRSTRSKTYNNPTDPTQGSYSAHRSPFVRGRGNHSTPLPLETGFRLPVVIFFLRLPVRTGEDSVLGSSPEGRGLRFHPCDDESLSVLSVAKVALFAAASASSPSAQYRAAWRIRTPVSATDTTR